MSTAMEWGPSDPTQPSPAAPSQSTALAQPALADLPETDHIVLDVDGHKYRTRKSILNHCDYFRNLLSGRWAVEVLPDGSLPLDVDPDIWPTLFTYLKRPAVFPLLWTKEKGFDYAAYHKLYTEAEFFGLDDLKDWIQQKKYLEAVKTGFKLQIHPGLLSIHPSYSNHAWLHAAPLPERLPNSSFSYVDDTLDRAIPLDNDPSVSEDLELVSCIEAKIPSVGEYKCPSGKRDHHHPVECTQTDCFNPAYESYEDYPAEYEQLPTSIVTVVKYTDYRPERCLKGYGAPNDEEEGKNTTP